MCLEWLSKIFEIFSICLWLFLFLFIVSFRPSLFEWLWHFGFPQFKRIDVSTFFSVSVAFVRSLSLIFKHFFFILQKKINKRGFDVIWWWCWHDILYAMGDFYCKAILHRKGVAGRNVLLFRIDSHIENTSCSNFDYFLKYYFFSFLT